LPSSTVNSSPPMRAGRVALAQMPADAFGHLLQETVADRVAVAVVDDLERIQIHEQHRHRGARTRRGVDRPLHAALEFEAVVQAGERVVAGQCSSRRRWAFTAWMLLNTAT
jgi:hypothetical protein